MHRHRLFSGSDLYRLPAPGPAPFVPAAFCWMPVEPLVAATVADCYRLAFERARAANTPSLPERDLFACPN